MKKIISTIGLFALLIASGVAGAAATLQPQTKMLTLYAQPNQHSRVVHQYQVNQPLTPFYRQGNWIKVGNSRDGAVGWVHTSTLQQQTPQVERVELNRPHSSAHVVPTTTETHVKQTPYGPVKIVTKTGEANGVKFKLVQSELEQNKMTQAEKTALFKKMRAQQLIIDHQIQANLNQLNREFRQFNEQNNTLK